MYRTLRSGPRAADGPPPAPKRAPTGLHCAALRVRNFRTVLVTFTVLLAATAIARAADYVRDIKPLLQARCYACHGALKQKGGLRLDTAALLLKGGESGPAVHAKDPAGSLLLQRTSSTKLDERMPPEHEGEPFGPAQLALLRDWIAAGAIAPADEAPENDPRDHWSFRPIRHPQIPSVRNRDWVRNPIDAFIAQDHERQGLTPVAPAPPRLLLRRLYLDLVGLPPTAAEIAAFEENPSPRRYEQEVDRLLGDPRHGERWARHWMDIWRYSDWWGLGDQLRNSQKHIWHWRDWIVESINADVPYDEMIRLMLAADELHPEDLGRLRATGFLARNYFLFNRNQWMEETVEHVGKGFLGLTLNCTKCHDHKYDPFAQADFYRFRAFFEPYHARLDVLPGEPDLARDGLPRAYDGWLDRPTYRFVRGDEGRPDKSAALAPGVPALLAFKPLEVHPVSLPKSAWQPERRPWVLEGYLQQARAALERADAAVGRLKATPSSTPGATAELATAEAAAATARAEWLSADARAEAQRAEWAASDPPPGADPRTLVEAARTSTIKAVMAEREVAAAKARQAVVAAEQKLARAAADQKDATAKELQAAREMLDRASQVAIAPVDPTNRFTRFTGASWTPTRFLNSTADDPTVVFPPQSTGRRTALADWITDPRNPLTARVAANHVWARHFGAPLAPTVFDLGRKGQPPVNPALLDWLAAELIDSGWSLRELHRRIVTSEAYRMSSSTAGDAAQANAAKDPENRHLWRRVPQRLEAEAVRDSILSLAGTLDLTLGGPPVPLAAQDDSVRRSLYFFHSYNERNTLLTTFDEAAVKECYRRDQSIVPQQALALANSRLVLDAAPRIARRIEDELAADPSPNGEGDTDFLRRAFLVLLGDQPTDAEIAATRRALEAWRKLPESNRGPGPRAHLVWVLLNHNDFVTLR